MYSSIVISSIVFVCIFCSALLGTWVRASLPVNHLDGESRDVTKLAIGLIATMAALVLGLLTASAKSSFDTIDSEIKHGAAQIILLDRVLAQYGPETQDTRALLRQAIAFRLNLTWPEDTSHTAQVEVPGTTPSVEGIEARIHALSPQNDAQHWLQSRALAISSDLMAARWLMFAQAGNTIPMPFLVVLVLWLIVLFASFGLLAPRNATVITILAICALSVAGSVLLILEMNQPLSGLIKVSSAPLRYALSHLGQ